LAYARSTCHPQIGSIDENKLVELYQELRRDSITAGGVPVAVRHIESIVRISEANAKMHLRDHVRNEDVDMAIRVMVESFIAAQKYSVQTTLRRKFRKYIVYKKHNNSLIMHILQQMVRDQMTFEQMRSGARGNIGNGGIDHDIERIEIREDDLLIRMRELDIHSITTFLKSREFSSHGFLYDAERKAIIRNV